MDPVCELKNLWNMKVTVILIVIGAHGEKKEIKERSDSILMTAMLKPAYRLKRILGNPKKTCCHLVFSE